MAAKWLRNRIIGTEQPLHCAIKARSMHKRCANNAQTLCEKAAQMLRKQIFEKQRHIAPEKAALS
jgi:hypothetical protein